MYTWALHRRLSNETAKGLLPAQCLADYPSIWPRCALVDTLYRYIKAPLFVLENQYDTNQIFAQEGVPKKTASAAEHALVASYIARYGEAMRNSTAQVVNNAPLAKKPRRHLPPVVPRTRRVVERARAGPGVGADRGRLVLGARPAHAVPTPRRGVQRLGPRPAVQPAERLQIPAVAVAVARRRLREAARHRRLHGHVALDQLVRKLRGEARGRPPGGGLHAQGSAEPLRIRRAGCRVGHALNGGCCVSWRCETRAALRPGLIYP